MQVPPAVPGREHQWNLTAAEEVIPNVNTYDISALQVSRRYLYFPENYQLSQQSSSKDLIRNSSSLVTLNVE